MTETTMLAHNRIELALHHLRGREGRPLLLLHGLGEASPPAVPSWADAWPGPVWALDFTGHGGSAMPRGGGYTAEILLADADTALAALGPATVLGRGLGAYIALQLAGSRPRDVVGAVLADGPGLAGGAPMPTSQSVVTLPPADGPPDPYALLELSRDLRPPDYAASFVRLAVGGSQLDEAITVAAVFRPPWLEAVASEPGVAERSVADALGRYTRARNVTGMRPIVIAVAAFVAMEPVTAGVHRFLMHGVGSRVHRSHHRRRHDSLEANDAFPVMFAAVVCAALWIGFNRAGWGDLVPMGVGVTIYGLAYGLVHDVYIHGRVRSLSVPRIGVLERLAAAHRVHHRTSGPPYGMLLPVVPRRSTSGSRPSHIPADA